MINQSASKILKITAIFFSITLSGCSVTPYGRLAAGLPETGPAIVEVADEAIQAGKYEDNNRLLESEACNLNVLGLVSLGDASIEAAAHKARIENIVETNRQIRGLNFGYLKIAQTCTIVRGTN